jgi:hypothetical protein
MGERDVPTERIPGLARRPLHLRKAWDVVCALIFLCLSFTACSKACKAPSVGPKGLPVESFADRVERRKRDAKTCGPGEVNARELCMQRLERESTKIVR